MFNLFSVLTPLCSNPKREFSQHQETSYEVDYRGRYRNKETISGGGIWCAVLIHYVALHSTIYSFVCPELMPEHPGDSWLMCSHTHI